VDARADCPPQQGEEEDNLETTSGDIGYTMHDDVEHFPSLRKPAG
jgi:hypothetical protein